MRALLTASLLASLASAQTGIRVIMMADDMGAAQGINAGTIRAYREGVVRATNVIIPGPWLLDAVRELKENPGLDVGVHLTLTSEWEFVKWRPVSHAPSLVDENGYFFPMVGRNPNFPARTALNEANPKPEDVERELRAQIETLKRLLPRVSFLLPHMGAATSTPERRAITERLAKEYALPLVPNIEGVRPLGRMYRQTDSAAEKAEALARRLSDIGPGTYWMIDHAAIDSPETRMIGHVGYRDVAGDRSGNVAMWTSKEVKEVVRRRNIQLTGWRDVLQEAGR